MAAGLWVPVRGLKAATNFYELEAQVKGGSSLEESLVSSPVSMMTNGHFYALCAEMCYFNISTGKH